MEKKKILYLVLIMLSYVNALGQYTDGESYNFCTLNGELYNPGKHNTFQTEISSRCAGT